MAIGSSKRQANGAAFFPQWIWEWIKIEEGEEITFQDDKGKQGKFISFWKKNGE